MSLRGPVLVLCAALSVLGLGACADDDEETASPVSDNPRATSPASDPNATAAPGSSIKLMTLTSETGAVTFKEIPPSARAAAKAINDAGGVNGHPIEILNCDTRFDPNGTGDCARRAVSEKVTAVIGAASPDGSIYQPILDAAGIPLVGNNPNSPQEGSGKNSFPISATALQFVAGGALLKATGATSVQYLGPNVPAYVGLLDLVKQLLPQVGIEFKGSTLYPVDATDYTQYVTSAYESGADSVNVTFVTSAGIPAFVNAIEGGGYSLDETPTTTFGSTFSPDVLDDSRVAKGIEGMYVINSGKTPTDDSLPGVKRFHDEIEAAGTEVEYTDAALSVWVSVHTIADLLSKAEGDVTAPVTLTKALETAGPIEHDAWTPFDWSKPALDAPLSEKFPRYFNPHFWASRVVNGKAVAAVEQPARFTGPVTLKDN
ncbi:ABC transporter substrate-binding protein [Sporichthya polymorpha]|uniref:ABC transporter substrate-binding protein n=1 Tax=Sporichthya polymorpha TaxID=35751 RepID=UPI00036DE8BE|nr:ABC transporter substrate-binding protein [Sporichthya polymorpha]